MAEVAFYRLAGALLYKAHYRGLPFDKLTAGRPRPTSIGPAGLWTGPANIGRGMNNCAAYRARELSGVGTPVYLSLDGLLLELLSDLVELEPSDFVSDLLSDLLSELLSELEEGLSFSADLR